MKQKTLFADVLETVTKYFLLLVGLVVVGIFFSGLRVVESGNVAVVLRFGRLVGDSYEEQVHEPGLMFAFPYIIDEVVVVPTGSVMEQSVTTHYTDPDGAVPTSGGGYVITGDQNVAVVSASVKYVISDPVAYALYVQDITSMINCAVSGAMLSEAASFDVDKLLTDGKDAYGTAVLTRADSKLQTIGAGITLTAVELTNVAMPEEVRAVYETVNSATVQATTIVERARQYRQNLIPAAQSSAISLIAAANSDKALKVAAANSDMAEFWGVKEEYETNPDVVTTRIYSARAISFMERLKKVYVVQNGDNKIVISP
ncbi:MAG: protease modulator HflK [Ruminococcaceae bacterium]|nr:protease modulator HflK [Oscillospiraceae bacterium]